MPAPLAPHNEAAAHRVTAPRHVLRGAAIGIAAAALFTVIYCGIWGLRFWTGDIHSTFSFEHIRKHLMLFGVVMFAVLGPIATAAGAISGAIAFAVRRRRRTAVTTL